MLQVRLSLIRYVNNERDAIFIARASSYYILLLVRSSFFHANKTNVSRARPPQAKMTTPNGTELFSPPSPTSGETIAPPANGKIPRNAEALQIGRAHV